MKYVCLLRGINVGGNHKVPMADLRHLFESRGFDNVQTYINSGNIVFDAKTTPDATELQKVMEETFGFDIPLLLVSGHDLLRIAAAAPEDWQNNLTEHKSDVIFLFPDADSPDILEKFGYRPEFETLLYVPGAVLSHLSRKNQTRSSLLRVIGTPLYRNMTVRNINTLRKLAEIVREV